MVKNLQQSKPELEQTPDFCGFKEVSVKNGKGQSSLIAFIHIYVIWLAKFLEQNSEHLDMQTV